MLKVYPPFAENLTATIMKTKKGKDIPTDLARSFQGSREAAHVWKSLPGKSQEKLRQSLEGVQGERLRQQRVKEVLKKSRSEFEKRARGAGF